MTSQRAKWTLQRESFELLLRALGSDRDSAGEAYERLRKRLVKFFSWERCPEPESCADETLNRIARALERGEVIQRMDHYALGVARLVLLEAKAQARKIAVISPELHSAPAIDEEAARAMACLEQCIEALDSDQRTLILEYYRGAGKSRIDHRRHLADELGIELNALRNRAMRLRERMEACVRAKLERKDP
jgi:DNA-directed RNA polymerase specialized sigma24 family protein